MALAGRKDDSSPPVNAELIALDRALSLIHHHLLLRSDGNMQTSAHISCVVCPPTDAAPQNSSFCPAVNLTATTQLYATGAYDLTYVTSLAGIYQVVVYDYQGNRIMDGLQRIFLPRSAPIDGEQSSLLVPPGGLSVGQPNNVIR